MPYSYTPYSYTPYSYTPYSYMPYSYTPTLTRLLLHAYSCTPTLDVCVWQLPAVLKNPDAYVHSTFFTEQLTGFEVWLELGAQLPRFPRTKPLVQLVQKYNY
jgi:hypothetical protein